MLVLLLLMMTKYRKSLFSLHLFFYKVSQFENVKYVGYEPLQVTVCSRYRPIGSGSLELGIHVTFNSWGFVSPKCSNIKIHFQFVVYIPAAEMRDCIFRYSRNNFHNATRYFHKECYAENVKIRFLFSPILFLSYCVEMLSCSRCYFKIHTNTYLL